MRAVPCRVQSRGRGRKRVIESVTEAVTGSVTETVIECVKGAMTGTVIESLKGAVTGPMIEAVIETNGTVTDTDRCCDRGYYWDCEGAVTGAGRAIGIKM